MNHAQLIEFARKRLADGASRADIESHLRGQNWGNEVIEEVMRAVTPSDQAERAIHQQAPIKKRSWRPFAAAALAALLFVGGFFAYRYFA
ncbi:MAG: hypothetical protein EBZ50_15430, partial [Alphaproteobacteria bacterium]|nr:hypothetical protein [Alphaproteobacteria bacterium]